MKTGEIVKPVTARRLGSLSLAATKPVWRRTPRRGARTADDNRTTTTIKPKRPHWGGESPAPSGRLSMSAAAKRGLPGRLLWVIGTHNRAPVQCPLYPRKRTCAVQLVMSALGQKRTCDRL